MPAAAAHQKIFPALVVVLALWAPSLVRAQALAAVPVELSPHLRDPALDRVANGPRVRVHSADSPGLAKAWGMPDWARASANHLDLDLQLRSHPGEPTSPEAALRESFIVDFNDPEVQRLHEQLLKGVGHDPVRAVDVVAFVAKSMRGDYNSNAALASKVARTLQGDCTEYSLLTAALARSFQIPARIVHGMVLLHTDGRWEAYGHAWVQSFESGRWTVRDSALASFSGGLYYVPAFVVTEEGPGYRLNLLQNSGRLPSRVEIIEPGRQEGVE